MDELPPIKDCAHCNEKIFPECVMVDCLDVSFKLDQVDGDYYVECPNIFCEARGPKGSSRKEAIEKWNHRPGPK